MNIVTFLCFVEKVNEGFVIFGTCLNLKIVVRFIFHYLATFKIRAKILLGPTRVFSQALYSRSRQKPSLPNLPLFQQIQHFLSLYRPRSVHRKQLSQQKTSKIYPNTSKESILIASEGVLGG